MNVKPLMTNLYAITMCVVRIHQGVCARGFALLGLSLLSSMSEPKGQHILLLTHTLCCVYTLTDPEVYAYKKRLYKASNLGLYARNKTTPRAVCSTRVTTVLAIQGAAANATASTALTLQST